MTPVVVRLADGTGALVSGSLECQPFRRHLLDDAVTIVLPQARIEKLTGETSIVLEPTTPAWCWSIRERVPGGIRRYVLVPESDTPVAYADLIDVDPTTLDPTLEPDPAWWAALQSAQDAIDTAQEAATTAASESASSAGAAESAQSGAQSARDTAVASAAAAAASEAAAEGAAVTAAADAEAAVVTAVSGAVTAQDIPGQARDAVDTVVTGLDLVQQYGSGDPGFLKAWIDGNDRVALGIRSDGSVIAPLLSGLTSIEAESINGITQSVIDPQIPGLWHALLDSQGRIAEPMAVGLDGRTPQWVLDAWTQRMNIPSAANTTYRSSYDSTDFPIVSGPDICMIGDSLTAGAGGGGTTYGTVLASLSGRTVYNNGVGGEGSVTITARMGGYPFTFTIDGGLIPAAVTPVSITIRPINGSPTSPLLQGGGGSGWIILPDGTRVNGAMTLVSGVYYFTRSTAGSDIACTRPVPYRRDSANLRRGDIYIIWIGQNGPSEARAIQDAKALIAHMTALDKRFLVIPRPTNNDAADTLWVNEFGERVILARKYLVEYGLADAGITPTSQDITDMAAGTVPTSLRADAVHWTAAGYTILGKLVFQRMKELGWL